MKLIFGGRLGEIKGRSKKKCEEVGRIVEIEMVQMIVNLTH